MLGVWSFSGVSACRAERVLRKMTGGAAEDMNENWLQGRFVYTHVFSQSEHLHMFSPVLRPLVTHAAVQWGAPLSW